MKTTIKWTEPMNFSGITPSGHELKMDAGEGDGGQDMAARPTEFLLYAVAGCTGIDIISILKKMRLEVANFSMDIEGTRAEEHPRRFTAIHVHYVLEGELPEDKVIRAIELSKDKYCSVAASLSSEITASYSINGQKGEQLV